MSISDNKENKIVNQFCIAPTSTYKFTLSMTDDSLNEVGEWKQKIKDIILEDYKEEFEAKGYSIAINFAIHDKPIKGNELTPYVVIVDKNNNKVDFDLVLISCFSKMG